MGCPSHDRVLDYVERRMAADARDEIERHVDGCPACRQLIAELAQTTAVEGKVGKARDEERIGRYRIEARLGSGGMGTVYVAHDPQLDRRVAIKLVHPELATGEGFERLLREGRALARLTHPNIVSVYDAGSDGDRVYIAMELVDGQTLEDWLKTQHAWREIVAMFGAVARGLAAAHDAGVVHRDIKPANVLIDRKGRPKVVDFGLASSQPRARAPDLSIDPQSRITEPGAVMGTPAFMSPEQWRGEDVTPATDQYSLCAALRIAIDEHKRPAWVNDALDRALQVDPNQRFPSMHALADALDPARRSRRNRRIAVAIAAPLLVAAATTVYIATRPAPDPISLACTTAATERGRIWTVADRVLTRVALDGINAKQAPAVFALYDKTMRSYYGRIARVEEALCSALPTTAAARASTTASLACLANSRAQVLELNATVTTLTRARLKAGIHLELDPPLDCLNAAVVAAARRVDADLALQVRRGMVKHALVHAKQVEKAGAHADAIRVARHTVAMARTLDDFWLANALIALGTVSIETDHAGAEAALREAAAITEQLQIDRLRASALGQLMQVLSRRPGGDPEVLALEPQMRALLARVDQVETIEPTVFYATGTAKIGLHRLDDGIRDLEAALAAARKQVTPRGRKLISYLTALARAYALGGRYQEGLALADEAVSIATSSYGADHQETKQARRARDSVLQRQAAAKPKP